MISPKKLHEKFAELGVSFFTGVPDSLLKEFCAYVDGALPPEMHVIAANEGAAVGIAAGNHLATGAVPVVYLQNSGLGNIINPLLSLADPEVYAMPMIVLIGWRGRPGEPDEPQHVKQGRVTPGMLDSMEIPFRILDEDEAAALDSARWAHETALERKGPVALLVQKGAFGRAEAKRQDSEAQIERLSREQAIGAVIEALPASATVVSTTGMISRELYEQRIQLDQDRSSDFLTVGSMGHASQIAFGLSNALPDRNVVCLDGDGAVLMHMGGLATIGVLGRGKLLHIVLNNGAHDSVGGQPTVAFNVSLTQIAKACGYDQVIGPVRTPSDIREALDELGAAGGRRFLEIEVTRGSRADLGRPKETPAANKAAFTKRLASLNDG